MDKLLAFIFIPVYRPQMKQWLFMEVCQDPSFQVDSHSVPNAPMGIIKRLSGESEGTWTKMGFPIDGC